jgi:predicted N-acetyltransferase YhbS
MVVELRPGQAEDAEACGRICYEAFADIARRHGFPPDFPSAEVAVGGLRELLSRPGFYSVVAEEGGRVVGSNFLDERSTIAGVGPITVDPGVQDATVGRRLMLDVMDRAGEKCFPGVRLVQAAYHNRSLALYAKLGFVVREPLATMQGPSLRETVPGHTVRAATDDDLASCNRVCTAVHGHDRSGDLQDAIKAGRARVVEHADRISGYSTGVAFSGHTVGESTEDVKALIGAAEGYGGPGFLLPVRNGELFLWCLERGLRVVHMMTLMSTGLYAEPAGAFLPSVHY